MMRGAWVLGSISVLALGGCGGGDGQAGSPQGASTGVGGSTGTASVTGTAGVGGSTNSAVTGATVDGGSVTGSAVTGSAVTGSTTGAPSQVIPAALPNGGSQTEFAVNLVDPDLVQALTEYLSQPTDVDYEDVDPNDRRELDYPGRAFYEYFKDEYDFLFFIAPDELDVDLNGLHSTVQAHTLPGTGVTSWSGSGEYFGSDGTLMSAIGFVFRSPEQRPPFAHEVMHHYAQHLDDSLGFGDAFLGGKAAHWGTVSVNGVLGGFDGASLRCKTPVDAMPPACTPEASGRIHYVVDRFSPVSSGFDGARPYAPLELYMMGVMTAEEIPQSYIRLDDASPEPVEIDSATGRMTVDASGMSEISVADIIEMHGPVRALPTEWRSFRGALVVLSNTPAGDEFMALANSWAASFGGVNSTAEWPSFETLTGGRATMDMRIGDARREDEPIVLGERFDPMCNIYAQDCAPGFACYDYPEPVCMPEGLAQLGEACEQPYDCALGLDCTFGNTGLSCAPYCDPMDPASPIACDTLCPGASAEVYGDAYDENGDITFPILGGVCLGGSGTGACDPLNQAECGAGNGCFGREATTCQPEGALALGETCFPLGVVCQAGSTCIGIEGQDAYCQPYCDPNGTGANSCTTLCPGGAWNYGNYSICIPA